MFPAPVHRCPERACSRPCCFWPALLPRAPESVRFLAISCACVSVRVSQTSVSDITCVHVRFRGSLCSLGNGDTFQNELIVGLASFFKKKKRPKRPNNKHLGSGLPLRDLCVRLFYSPYTCLNRSELAGNEKAKAPAGVQFADPW